MDNHIRITIDFIDTDPGQSDPASVTAAADDAVAALRAAGYEPKPAYTGAMGGEFFELLQRLADGAAENKDVVLALITNVAAPIAGALADRIKQRAVAAPSATATPPVEVEVEGAKAQVSEPEITPEELLRRLLENDPTLPQRVSPQTQPKIRYRVPPKRRPRR